MATGDVSRFANRSMTFVAGVGFVLAWALLAGLGGPFGMTVTQPDLLSRVAHFAVCAVVAATSTLLIETVLARFLGWPGMLTLAAAAGLAAIPTTFAVDASLRILSPASRPGLLELGAETLVINLVLTFLVRRLLGDRFLLRQPSVAANTAAPMAEFLPPEFRTARVLVIQADDHYLRVHTDRGVTLVHMRIAEAERLLAAEDGVRTHRSFWVARRALLSVTRRAGRVTLELHGGLAAPVARARVTAVDAWLAGAPSPP